MSTNAAAQIHNEQIAALYASYGLALLAYLRRMVDDHQTAEDLCQETFIKAMRGWEQRDTSASAVAWLYRIATNTAYDHLRRRRRIRFQPIEETSAYDSSLGESRIADQEPVQQALAQIPPMYRLPLVMHSCNGHSTREIASALGCSNSAVKTRLFRARERFREVYRQ